MFEWGGRAACHAEKRTSGEMWRHIGQLVSTMEPGECENYFANAGYPSVNIMKDSSCSGEERIKLRCCEHS